MIGSEDTIHACFLITLGAFLFVVSPKSSSPGIGLSEDLQEAHFVNIPIQQAFSTFDRSYQSAECSFLGIPSSFLKCGPKSS